MTDLVDQLLDELDRVLVHPVRSLLGLDLGEVLSQQLPERVTELAASLTSDADEEAAIAARELLNALWPAGVLDPDWWRTALGLVCARAIGATDSDSVSQHTAAGMLGISRNTVATMMRRGTLDRHPDGGVLRASVLQRLAR